MVFDVELGGLVRSGKCLNVNAVNHNAVDYGLLQFITIYYVNHLSFLEIIYRRLV